MIESPLNALMAVLVPLLKEDATLQAMYCVIAPKGLPKDVLDKLTAASLQVVHSPEWIKFAKDQGSSAIEKNGPEVVKAEMDHYLIHQVSLVHTAAICQRLGFDQSKAPLTFPTRGNIGPASVPYTMADHAPNMSAGDRVICMGIGSGLNVSALEIVW